MSMSRKRSGIPSVGIDLGTTYSSLAYLDPQGTPITVPNAEGEMTTPSAVFFDGNEPIVGSEALRHAVTAPERVVVHAKRWMGDPQKCWVIDGAVYGPKDISSLVLRKLLDSASETLGRIRHAVVTVPAQFSELQRQDTVDAGLQAGLERVDIINEPVAAAICHVLGEGLWFSELANEQTVLVFDLGGGTLDLALVKYNRDEVRVIASGGDLKLGGLDWNKALVEFACDEYVKESISDPRLERESMQALAIEVEQVKRSLSVRPRSVLTVQHEGRRKTYSIDREQFESLTSLLVERARTITQNMLKSHKLGWAHVDAILITGGASRMPMVRNMLQGLSGTTQSYTLSPDQSICHGAAYYAGILLSGRQTERPDLNRKASQRLAGFRQQSVSGRALGILVRRLETGDRTPHYLIPANTPLPCAFRQQFGTVIANQGRVHLRIVESGTSPEEPHVEIGECLIEGLTEGLPTGAPIEVTIRYDEQNRIHVEAVEIASNARAQTTILRNPSQNPAPAPDPNDPALEGALLGPVGQAAAPPKAPPPPPKTQPAPAVEHHPAPRRPVVSLEEASQPIPLCNACGEILDSKGRCPRCRVARPAVSPKAR